MAGQYDKKGQYNFSREKTVVLGKLLGFAPVPLHAGRPATLPVRRLSLLAWAVPGA